MTLDFCSAYTCILSLSLCLCTVIVGPCELVDERENEAGDRAGYLFLGHFSRLMLM